MATTCMNAAIKIGPWVHCKKVTPALVMDLRKNLHHGNLFIDMSGDNDINYPTEINELLHGLTLEASWPSDYKWLTYDKSRKCVRSLLVMFDGWWIDFCHLIAMSFSKFEHIQNVPQSNGNMDKSPVSKMFKIVLGECPSNFRLIHD